MAKWEYNTVTFETTGFGGGKLNTESFNDRINILGQQGWELVSCFDTNMFYGETKVVVAVMKRAVSD
jgi:hypothetical protein